MAFEAQDRIQTIAEAYALECGGLREAHFGIDLDWTDGKMFGSYVGELFRKNHGARWGIVTLGEHEMPGLEAEITRAQFWPWAKVEKRIENGPEDNVWHYFQVLRSRDGKGPKLEQLDLSQQKRSWWKKLTGGT